MSQTIFVMLIGCFAIYGYARATWALKMWYFRHKGWSVKCEKCRGFGGYLVTPTKDT